MGEEGKNREERGQLDKTGEKHRMCKNTEKVELGGDLPFLEEIIICKV